MKIALPALAVAFAAFFVWLTVQIINRRKGWTKWTVVLVELLVGYPLSLGPVVWLDAHNLSPQWTYDVPLYKPIELLRKNGPDPISTAIDWYVGIWADELR